MLLDPFPGSATQLIPAIVDETKSIMQFSRVGNSVTYLLVFGLIHVAVSTFLYGK